MKITNQFNLIDKGLKVDMALSRESLIACLYFGRFEPIEEREIESFPFDLDDNGVYQQRLVTINVYVRKLSWDEERGQLLAHIYKAPKRLGKYQLMITKGPAINEGVLYESYFADLKSAKAAAIAAGAKAWNY
jgi:hypothetical protein